MEFFIEGFNPDGCLADRSDLSVSLFVQKQLNGLVNQLLVQRMIISADGNDPGFIF